ncbi:hypothetical protein PMAC_001497 [Pneumocystis sp. 'macacae']|nr:hypothetical protein PMAC_001497 [Pneumocystis sp. 'macacae']
MIREKTVFVTVGSTRFDALISSIQQKEIQKALIRRGFSKILVQYGNSRNIFNDWQPVEGLKVNGFDYSKDIEKAFKESDLIISHAGSGSIIEALELKKQLIIVVNETLMDNHQTELTEEMSRQKYLISSTPKNLLHAIENFDEKELKPFPFPRKALFPTILDNHMGLN